MLGSLEKANLKAMIDRYFTEWKCSICGKSFLVTNPELYVYLTDGDKQCSYSCYRVAQSQPKKANKERISEESLDELLLHINQWMLDYKLTKTQAEMILDIYTSCLWYWSNKKRFPRNEQCKKDIVEKINKHRKENPL